MAVAPASPRADPRQGRGGSRGVRIARSVAGAHARLRTPLFLVTTGPDIGSALRRLTGSTRQNDLSPGEGATFAARNRLHRLVHHSLGQSACRRRAGGGLHGFGPLYATLPSPARPVPGPEALRTAREPGATSDVAIGPDRRPHRRLDAGVSLCGVSAPGGRGRSAGRPPPTAIPAEKHHDPHRPGATSRRMKQVAEPKACPRRAATGIPRRCHRAAAQPALRGPCRGLDRSSHQGQREPGGVVLIAAREEFRKRTSGVRYGADGSWTFTLGPVW